MIKYFSIIKLALIFQLFNKFFVQIAQKIIMLSDLDLSFTKYYKKRLKFRLKIKKKRYANNYISTK